MTPEVDDNEIESSAIAYRALPPEQQKQRLVELAALFFRLGLVAFGGPAAHVAMMDDEVVKRRQWMSRESLLDLIGVTNLLPGPNSTELAIHIGYERGGWKGLFVAGLYFACHDLGLGPGSAICPLPNRAPSGVAAVRH